MAYKLPRILRGRLVIYNPSAIDVTIRAAVEQTELLGAGTFTKVAPTAL